MESNISVGDNLQIAGVQYVVKHIESCNDCCLNGSRVCGMLDPAITCGNKTHLGFKTIGFNPTFNQINKQSSKNKKQYIKH